MNFAISMLTIVIPSVLLTVLYCQLAKRSGVGEKWILASCATLAVLASSAAFWRAGSGHWMFGLLWPGVWNGGGWLALAQHLVNLIVPLAIGWWFLRRRHDPGQLQLAS